MPTSNASTAHCGTDVTVVETSAGEPSAVRVKRPRVLPPDADLYDKFAFWLLSRLRLITPS